MRPFGRVLARLLGGFSPVEELVRNHAPGLLDFGRALEELAQQLPGLDDPRTFREVRGSVRGDANAPVVVRRACEWCSGPPNGRDITSAPIDDKNLLVSTGHSIKDQGQVVAFVHDNETLLAEERPAEQAVQGWWDAHSSQIPI